MKKILTTPLRDEDIESLSVGDIIYLFDFDYRNFTNWW